MCRGERNECMEQNAKHLCYCLWMEGELCDFCQVRSPMFSLYMTTRNSVFYIRKFKNLNELCISHVRESWDGVTTSKKVGHGSCWKDSKIALLQFNSICISQWCKKERTIMNDQTNQATTQFSLGGLSEDSTASKHAPPNFLCSSNRNKSSTSFDELHLPYTHTFHIHTYFC